MPVKFTASPVVYQAILDRHRLQTEQSWSIGDSWKRDLAPARLVGLRTIAIGEGEGEPDFRFENLADALNWLATNTPLNLEATSS